MAADSDDFEILDSSSGGVYEFDLEESSSDAGMACVEEVEVEVLTLGEIESRQRTLMEEVGALLAISPDVAGLLLHHFGWSRERLRARYFEDPERVTEMAGVKLSPAEDVEDPDDMCMICCSDMPADNAFALNCGHTFCRDCWSGHIKSKVSLGPSCLTTRCMMTQCPVAMDLGHIRELASPEDLEKYLKLMVSAFVDSNSHMRWCTNPTSCGNVAHHRGIDQTNVLCTCGFKFCFSCGEEWHNPALCDQVRQWNLKASSEAENTKWIIANTKPCPKCSVYIQKNQGCMHMTCRQCSHEFCWLCRGPWSEHGSSTGGYYKCNRYEKSDAREEDFQAEAVRKAHDRYLHYFNRWHNHGESKNFAETFITKIEGKMQDYANETGWSPEFLMQAAILVTECRHVLQWTYVYAYYCEDDAERNLFEFLQEDLETNTEKLNGLIESPVESLDPSRLKNYTRITRGFLHKLIDGCKRGLTNQDEDAL